MTMEKNEDKFIYTWVIENLRYCPFQNGQYFSSPSFTVPQFENTTWCFNMYPSGSDKNCDEYMSLYLYRMDKSGPECVKIIFNIGINSIFANAPFEAFFRKNTSLGKSNFQKRAAHGNEEKFENPLIIECHMQLCTGKFQFQPAKNVTSQTFRDTVEELLPMCDPIQSATQSVVSKPHHCLARTRFETENLYFVWPIEKNINNGTKDKLILPIYPNIKFLFLSLGVDKREGNEYLSVQINLVDTTFAASILMFCRIKIFNVRGELVTSAEIKRVFLAGQTHEICFVDYAFEWEALKREMSDFSLNQLNSNFEFILSTGAINSNIEWTEYNLENHSYSLQRSSNHVSSSILHLYKENKFCDVTLQVGNQTYPMHKTVLCASSPVFSAMFSSGMIESNLNIINIKDLDHETVKEMIIFMYTGTVEELRWEMAKKLYVAADKYNISLLLKLSREFIIENINLENIFEVLLFPQLPNDGRLRNRIIKFIYLYKHLIFPSKRWQWFENINPVSALEILRLVCMY